MRPQLERIDELLKHGDPPVHLRQAVGASALSGLDLMLERVWFRYERGYRWVLEEQSCRFPAHQLTELRAASGAGKTTMLRLLAGLLEPERGTVRVLGRCARETRQLVTYLPHRSALLEASIATNLRVLSGRSLERLSWLRARSALRHGTGARGTADPLQRLRIWTSNLTSRII